MARPSASNRWRSPRARGPGGQAVASVLRGFLKVSNGFARVSFAIDEVFAAADVRPFAAENANWIAAYGEHDPALGQLLSAAWQGSEAGDGVLLLHPDVVNAEGEWAASLFANWIPGLDRHEIVSGARSPR